MKCNLCNCEEVVLHTEDAQLDGCAVIVDAVCPICENTLELTYDLVMEQNDCALCGGMLAPVGVVVANFDKNELQTKAECGSCGNCVIVDCEIENETIA